MAMPDAEMEMRCNDDLIDAARHMCHFIYRLHRHSMKHFINKEGK